MTMKIVCDGPQCDVSEVAEPRPRRTPRELTRNLRNDGPLTELFGGERPPARPPRDPQSFFSIDHRGIRYDFCSRACMSRWLDETDLTK